MPRRAGQRGGGHRDGGGRAMHQPNASAQSSICRSTKMAASTMPCTSALRVSAAVRPTAVRGLPVLAIARPSKTQQAPAAAQKKKEVALNSTLAPSELPCPRLPLWPLTHLHASNWGRLAMLADAHCPPAAAAAAALAHGRAAGPTHALACARPCALQCWRLARSTPWPTSCRAR